MNAVLEILLVAPQPFYTARGTPIAVRLLVETLRKLGHRVTILCYHEGEDLSLDGVDTIRIGRPPGVRNVPIGPSWKKLVCDLWLLFRFLRLRPGRRFDCIHAVEEAAWMAATTRWLHGLPYVVDMDSSIPNQIGEKYRWAAPFLAPLRLIERWTVRHAAATTAVCDALADIARSTSPRGSVHVIEDVALLDGTSAAPSGAERLRDEFGIREGVPLLLYVGNLEPYQGVTLLLEALVKLEHDAALVVVGGRPSEIQRHRELSSELGLEGRVHFAGARPLEELGWNLSQADVLVSPRTKGNNTPMKIYSYLASGVPVVATAIPSHTQVLTPEVAVLAPPTPEGLAGALGRLLDAPDLRSRLAKNASRLVDDRFSRTRFEEKVARLYSDVVQAVGAARGRAGASTSG